MLQPAGTPCQTEQVRAVSEGKLTAKKHMGILRNIEKFPVRG